VILLFDCHEIVPSTLEMSAQCSAEVVIRLVKSRREKEASNLQSVGSLLLHTQTQQIMLTLYSRMYCTFTVIRAISVYPHRFHASEILTNIGKLKTQNSASHWIEIRQAVVSAALIHHTFASAREMLCDIKR